MKTKLLKKLHKRYNWYFNKEKYPVLIDKVLKKAIVYDFEYCCNQCGIKIEDLDNHVKCDKYEWTLRIMKRKLLSEYGWSFDRSIFKQALKRYKERL